MKECIKIIKSQIEDFYFNKKDKPTKNELEKKIPLYEKICGCELNEREKTKLVREILSENQFYMEISAEVSKNGYSEWYSHWIEEQKKNGKSDNEIFYYNDRYEKYLLKNLGFPPRIVRNISDINTRILNYIQNPNTKGRWKCKGLVMGYVQSGKTANYISLINKAADAGYKLIILIAGIHNNLRAQTQKRINEGFIGYDFFKNQPVGVGLIDNRRRPNSLTNTEDDFKKNSVRQFGFSPDDFKEPVVLVIKKNPNTLKNLIDWLEASAKAAGGRLDYPLLLIDDEADNASINTSKTDITKINRQIRKILNMFERRTYIGYTATPFANIFIDNENVSEEIGDDLFPEDFIVALNAPDNYIGAKTLFLDKKFRGRDYDIVRHINDNEDCIPVKHKKGFFVECLPDSLEEAVQLFLLASAIKYTRDPEKMKYTSMLVNVSFRTEVQNQLRYKIQDYMDDLLRELEFNAYKSDDVSELIENETVKSLYELYIKEYVNNDYRNEEYENLESDFPKIIRTISEIEDRFRVLAVNSSKIDEPLKYDDYPDGINIIAVGGYSLSRGFTLEGLTVSYFLRNTKMYDTLLQMGRWFGYRNGYEDLCRIYMTPVAENWYAYIADVVEELKDDLKRMEVQRLQPKDYGLKIRTHPESLAITARNKMYSAKDAVLKACYSDELVETRIVSATKEDIEKNFEIFGEFVSELGNPDYGESEKSSYFLWKEVDYKKVVSFLKKYRNHRLSIKTDGNLLTDYIEKGSDHELGKWDVAVKNIRKNDKISVGGLEIGKTLRSADRDEDMLVISGSKHRVGDPRDESIGLDSNAEQMAKRDFEYEKEKALLKEGYSKEKIREMVKKAQPGGKYYRKYRKRPLLVLYVIDIKEDKNRGIGPNDFTNITAFGISFPKIKDKEVCDFNRLGIYKVNKIYWRQIMRDEIEEIEENLDE